MICNYGSMRWQTNSYMASDAATDTLVKAPLGRALCGTLIECFHTLILTWWQDGRFVLRWWARAAGLNSIDNITETILLLYPAGKPEASSVGVIKGSQ
jgi:hypothetical protein